MKRIVSTMLIATACITFVACNNQKKDKEVSPDTKKMADDKPAVSDGPQTYYITGPEGWVQEDSMVAGRKHTKIGSPSDGPGDKFKENMNVNSESAPGYSSKQYGEANIATIKNQIPGVVVEDLGESMINGIAAECYTYEFDYQGVQLKDIAWYLAKDDVGYVITSTALRSTFDKYLPTFKACANTFKLK